ncbi:putative nuclear transport factor 2 [Dermatophagoides pteronyssinus]|uniref:Nuclear transport factor 2 n=3 Tax=Pyroglyphidae TaxID=6952 RepID=A0A1Y3BTC9_EURMA|nr:probable nuclear transport factor 2 [Dermatophagoides pteronyssinus]KAH9416163.1 Nuclear transport factor 2 [Dermatophagoides pteronyssinus]OTF84211.1 nuclear transport factor 2-like protein [Euroglyphus maynei]
MALNPNYEQIGKTFVQQYYAIMDDNNQRLNVANFYSETNSLMTFEGSQLMGRAKILEKFQSLTFQKIQHLITVIDSQPTFDGGVLVTVLGQLKTDDDPPHTFNQTFVLKPMADTFFVEHDIFRLALHA